MVKDKNDSAVIAAFLGALFAIVLLSFLFSYPLMLLWNMCLVPAVTTLKEVTMLQMWGISILFLFLFKSTNYKSN